MFFKHALDQSVEKQINGKYQENQRVLRMDLDSLMSGLPKERKIKSN